MMLPEDDCVIQAPDFIISYRRDPQRGALGLVIRFLANEVLLFGSLIAVT